MATIYGVDIGSWYRTPAGHLFEVVSLDADAIEVQYDDGDLEEIDQEAWLEMELIPSAPPASALLPFDIDVADDQVYEPDRQTLDEVLGSIEFTDLRRP
jgi:hypothetical protein